MKPIVAGNPAPIPQPVEKLWRALSGSEQIHSWIGVKSEAEAMYESLKSNGATEVSIQSMPGNALAKVSARYSGTSAPGGDPSGNDVEETLTISFVDQPIPINRHPRFVNITSDVIRQLDEWARNDSRATADLPADALGKRYIKLIRREVTHYRALFPKLRYTRTAPNNTGESLSVQEGGTIYAKSEVASRVAAPVIFTIPDANVGIAKSDDAGDFIVGYRLIPDFEIGSDGKVALIEEYEFGLWETDLYPTS